jgi:hypothetical protein
MDTQDNPLQRLSSTVSETAIRTLPTMCRLHELFVRLIHFYFMLFICVNTCVPRMKWKVCDMLCYLCSVAQLLQRHCTVHHTHTCPKSRAATASKEANVLSHTRKSAPSSFATWHAIIPPEQKRGEVRGGEGS